MKGKIANFKAEKGFGFIIGEDHLKYFFHISNVSNPIDIEENYMVKYELQETKKGLNAINIIVQTPLSGGQAKDKILKIKDLRIRASDIKEYAVIKELHNGEFPDDELMYKYHENYMYNSERSETILSRNLEHTNDYFGEKTGKFIFDEYSRYCYTLEITTYTSGMKYIHFISYDEDLNKKEAYRWLDYIDSELEKLI